MFNSSRLAIGNHELKAQHEEFVGGADQELYMQWCSGAGTHGNGVPT